MEGVSAEQIGIFVLIMMGLGKFVMDWLKHRREEADQYERRSNPSIDEKIEMRIGQSEARHREELARLCTDHEKHTRELHGRISSLRDDFKASLERIEDKHSSRMEAFMERLSKIGEETAKQLGELKASVTTLAQQQHSTNQQLQRHIESQKNKQ